jgi:hypothetical protein
MMPPGGFRRTYRRLIHLSAWKEYSQESICRTVHRAQVLRRSRPLLTLKAQTSDHYMLRVRIKMRSGQYAAPREDADAGAGGRQEFRGRLIAEGPAVLTLMCV